MTRLLILFLIFPFLLMAISITLSNAGQKSKTSYEASELKHSLASALSIAAGGFGFITLILIITLILMERGDSANLIYNILLLAGYGLVFFKTQKYTFSIIKKNKKVR